MIIASETQKLRLAQIKLLANCDIVGKKKMWDLIIGVCDSKIPYAFAI